MTNNILFEKNLYAVFIKNNLNIKRDLNLETFSKVSKVIFLDNSKVFDKKGLVLFISKYPKRPTNLKFLSQNKTLK